MATAFTQANSLPILCSSTGPKAQGDFTRCIMKKKDFTRHTMKKIKILTRYVRSLQVPFGASRPNSSDWI